MKTSALLFSYFIMFLSNNSAFTEKFAYYTGCGTKPSIFCGIVWMITFHKKRLFYYNAQKFFWEVKICDTILVSNLGLFNKIGVIRFLYISEGVNKQSCSLCENIYKFYIGTKKIFLKNTFLKWLNGPKILTKTKLSCHTVPYIYVGQKNKDGLLDKVSPSFCVIEIFPNWL